MLIHNGTPYYYITNLQGDVVRLVNNLGATVAEYTYDVWGKVLTSTGSMAEINPLLYRGYYYDSELEMYYLQSRYYDPAIGRFINADALVSTGQGFLGYNMFAYCGNNPVDRADPEGKIWRFFLLIGACILGCTGCSSCCEVPDGVREDIAQAPNLDIYTAERATYNCYGNAIGKQINTNPTGWHEGATAEDVFGFVQNDLGGSKNCIQIDYHDSPVPDGWYRVALKTGDKDYHFIRQDEQGLWINKSGKKGWCVVSEALLVADTWIGRGMNAWGREELYPEYSYAGNTIYFAVREGWWKA